MYTRSLVAILSLSALLGAGCASETVLPLETSPTSTVDAKSSTTTAIATTSPVSHDVTPPLDHALDRVTKKPFGLYVTPKNSPVSPEKFSGYHTGVDFETTVAEANVDIPVFTICGGPLRLKKWATGYGGVAVQQCTLNSQLVTVVYGHLQLASIHAVIGEKLSQGEKLGILGKGNSTETDGERKHLHLGIHKGALINILGYVQNKSQLTNWLDVRKYLSL